jgi:hypothetical protein
MDEMCQGLGMPKTLARKISAVRHEKSLNLGERQS